VREIAGLLLRFKLDESLRHAVKPERSQLVESGMREHC
jgi:hypothetical protein